MSKNLNEAGAVILTLPDGSKKEFNSGQEAQQWMSENGYSSYVWAKDNSEQAEDKTSTENSKNTSLFSSPQFQDVFGSGNPIWGSSRTNLWTQPIGTKLVSTEIFDESGKLKYTPEQLKQGAHLVSVPKYFDETETYRNFREANDVVARGVVNTFLAPSIFGEVSSLKNGVQLGKDWLTKGRAKKFIQYYWRNPTLLAWDATTKVAVPSIASHYGGKVVDYATKKLNGKTWGENVSEYTNWNPYVSEMTNPGYIFSWKGVNWLDNAVERDVAKRVYKYVTPASYMDKGVDRGKEVKNIFKSFATREKINVNEYPSWYYDQRFPHPTLSRKAWNEFRDEAFRKYLGLPKRPNHNLYLSNGDGTFSYNTEYIDELRHMFPNETELSTYIHNIAIDQLKSEGALTAENLLHRVKELNKTVTSIPKTVPLQQQSTILYNVPTIEWGKSYLSGDFFAGNGGYVTIKTNPTTKTFTMEDMWDVEPFKDINRMGKSRFAKFMHKTAPDFELSKVLGKEAKPFTLRHEYTPTSIQLR